MQTAHVIALQHSATVQCAAQSGGERFRVMKVGYMARIALPMILSCMLASGAVAQEAVPETPPELRDFRLDPERPAPQPVPQPEVQPPPVAPAEEITPQPNPPRNAAREVSPTRQPTRATTDAEPTAPSEVVSPQTEILPKPDAELVTPATKSTAPIAATPTASTASSGMSMWQIAMAILVALALIGGWLFYRKRREMTVGETTIAPTQPSIILPTPDFAPAPETAPVIADIAKRPRLSLEFIPEKATLGFSALTLKGQLRIVNDGDAPAVDMQLRATMISASQRQKETIAAFHGGAIPITPNSLGEAKIGERLALDIEMSVPVKELDSYVVGEKKIFVPVMLANLAYDWEGGSDNVTMAWMVGRESEPQQPKMGPLRLDLGPRSFAPLGQRPIYT